jgi:chromate transporter
MVEDTVREEETPGLADIFFAFSGMAIMGFGGVVPWTRRALVEQRTWLSPEEFAELLSLCQFLPGGNVVNLAILVGRRFRGVPGSLVALAGIMAAPTLIVLLLGTLYLAYGQTPRAHAALDGVTAAAAGLILAMAAKMAAPLFTRRGQIGLAMAALTFVGVGLFRFSLPLVMAVLAPVSVALAWRSLK